MFDIEYAPNSHCIREKCKYLKKTSTNQYDNNGYPKNLDLWFCMLDVKERFDKCPLWLKSCREIGLFDEERFQKMEYRNLDEESIFSVFDKWKEQPVEYLPNFIDEHRCDMFIKWLNELCGSIKW